MGKVWGRYEQSVDTKDLCNPLDATTGPTKGKVMAYIDKVKQANQDLTADIEEKERLLQVAQDNMFDLQQFRDKVLEALSDDMPDCFKMDKLRQIEEDERERIGDD
jgi:hypothetical protein